MVEKSWLICVGLCCLFAIGCGNDGKPRRVPVAGVITYNGKPVPEGDVVFVPVDAAKGFRARGKANKNGQFTLTTFDEGDGAVPGEYKVTIFAYRPVEPKRDGDMIAPRVGLPAVPKKYFDQQTTDLSATVGDDATEVQLDLKDWGVTAVPRLKRRELTTT